MVKISSGDIVAILRRFNVANEETVPRYIEQIKITNPSATNTMAAFRFAKQHYYILFDDTAEDDIGFVTDQVRVDKQDVNGEVLENPNDHITTYALPFKGKDVYLFAVQSLKMRLDSTLAERYPEYSRSTWQKYIKAGYVTVNDTVQTSPKYDITSADALSVSIPDAADHSEESLPILYIDDNVIVINKPIGVLSHSKGVLNDEFTVATFFGRYCDYNLESNRPGIIHRLDRDTSGVMIGARNAETASMLQAQFAERKTKKTYMAIVSGIPKLQSASLDLPIARNPSAPSTFRVDAKGKIATTTYEVIDQTDKLALVRLKPHTGRTHQLRVHMMHIGTPILGDKVYGKAKPTGRLFLHAASLEITIPGGKRMTFSAPLPKEFNTYFPQ